MAREIEDWRLTCYIHVRHLDTLLMLMVLLMLVKCIP